MTQHLRLPVVLLAAWAATGTATARDLQSLDLSLHESDIEPTVTVKRYSNRTVEEYRLNNHLYQIKITPAVGAPYYLVDEDGSGDMAWHRGQTGTRQNIPQWALMRW